MSRKKRLFLVSGVVLLLLGALAEGCVLLLPGQYEQITGFGGSVGSAAFSASFKRGLLAAYLDARGVWLFGAALWVRWLALPALALLAAGVLCGRAKKPRAAVHLPPPSRAKPYLSVPQMEEGQHASAPGFCGKCGSPLRPGGSFCPRCGAPLPQRRPADEKR